MTIWLRNLTPLSPSLETTASRSGTSIANRFQPPGSGTVPSGIAWPPPGQGVTDGEFRAGIDPELAAQALLGPIFYRRLMTSDPLGPGHAEDLIDMIVGSPS